MRGELRGGSGLGEPRGWCGRERPGQGSPDAPLYLSTALGIRKPGLPSTSSRKPSLTSPPTITHQLGAPIPLCSCYSQHGLHQVSPPSLGLLACGAVPLTGHVTELMSVNACRTELDGPQARGNPRGLNFIGKCHPWLISWLQAPAGHTVDRSRLEVTSVLSGTASEQEALVTFWCQ